MTKQSRDYVKGKERQYISNRAIYDKDVLYAWGIYRELYDFIHNLKPQNKREEGLLNSKKVIWEDYLKQEKLLEKRYVNLDFFSEKMRK